MAKWTKNNNPHTWGKRKRSTPAARKKGTSTMAKAKKRARRAPSGGKSKRRRSSRRGGSGGLTKKELMWAGGAAAAYGWLAHKQEKNEAPEWFKKPPVLLTPVGRAGTAAALAYGLYKMKVAPQYTKAIAYGLAAVTLVQLGRRGFETYKSDDEALSYMAGDGADDGAAYLAGDVDLAGEDLGFDVDDVGDDGEVAGVDGEVIDIHDAA